MLLYPNHTGHGKKCHYIYVERQRVLSIIDPSASGSELSSLGKSGFQSGTLLDND
jgi:hypothetical protein